MAFKKLVFNGISSADLGLVIQTTPTYNYPERDVTKTHVPGRNGDVIVDNNSYKNITREYNMAKDIRSVNPNNFYPNVQKILDWLHSCKGQYKRLEDDYDPEVYRMATFVQGSSISNILDGALTFPLVFDCKPQRFLKSGELPIEFPIGQNVVNIKNLHYFDALPKIKIENLPTGTDYVTLMLTKHDDISTSVITLRNIEPNETVFIDSNTYDCYNGTESITSKLSLNGKRFPVLENGETTIDISQYVQHTGKVKAYSTLISDEQEVAKSVYSPYDTTVASLENTFLIPSLNSVISENENRYDALAYQAYIEAECDNENEGILDEDGSTYLAQKLEIVSPNDVLDSYAQTITFSKDYSDMDGVTSNLINITQIGSTDTYTVTVKTGKKCLVRYLTESKEIRVYNSGSVIIDNSGSLKSGSVEISFWEYDETDNYHVEAIRQIASNLPSKWLYLNDSVLFSNGKLNKFSYCISADCYVWKDKTGILSKAKWTAYTNQDELINYTWSSFKKKFNPSISTGGVIGTILGTSSDSVVFKFCDVSNMLPQYPLEQGQPELFTIVDDPSPDFSKIKIKFSKTGYYKLTFGKNISTNWISCTAGSTYSSSVSTTVGFTVEYLKEIPTLSSVNGLPNWLDNNFYASNGQTGLVVLNSDDVRFKFKTPAWYRKYKDVDGTLVPVKDNTVESDHYKGWFKKNSDSSITGDSYYFSALPNASLQIGRLMENPNPNATLSTGETKIELYDYDRYYEKIVNGVTVKDDEPPSWLNVSVSMEITLDKDALFNDTVKTYTCERVLNDPSHPDDTSSDDQAEWKFVWKYTDNGATTYFYVKEVWCPDEKAKIYDITDPTKTIGLVHKKTTIDYKISSVGYYKFDSNLSWVYYPEVSGLDEKDRLLTSGAADTNTFYFMDELPDPNESSQIEQGDFFDNLELDVVPKQANPEEITIKIKNESGAGFYKAQNSVNWTYHGNGDTVCTALINETINIYKLVPTETEELDDIKITITPNWWTL